MTGVTYDSGALIAAENNGRTIWAEHKALLEQGISPWIPAGVLAEVWRGGARQASLARLLDGCEVDPLDEARAKAVGVLAGASSHNDIVDVHVGEVAARLGHFAVYTSNRMDIRRVLQAARSRAQIRNV
jgi:hypothetical protein